MPVYKIQLNDDPKDRWKALGKLYKDELQHLVKLVKYLPIPKSVYEKLREFAKSYKYQDYIAEMEGFAEAGEVPMEDILLFNLANEFSSFLPACSSVIIRNETGHLLHGRNMDFFLWNQFSKFLAEIEVYKGDNLVYTEIKFVGTFFTLSGMKPGKFDVTVNTRYWKHIIRDISEGIDNIFNKQYIPSAYLVRKVLEEEDDFQHAVERLANTNITAPIYFTVTGNLGNQGVVLERNPVGTFARHYLTDDQFYMVVTNHDIEDKDPIWDHRRAPTEKAIKKKGQNWTADELFEFMTKWPRLNIASIYTMTTVVYSGEMQSSAWYNVQDQQ